MRTRSDTLEDIESMHRCLKREEEVTYAKDYYANLYEDAFRRVNADLSGDAQAIRLLVPERDKLADAIHAHVLLKPA